MIHADWEELWGFAEPYLDFIIKETQKVILYFDFPGYSDDVYMKEVYRTCKYPIMKVMKNPNRNPKKVRGELANNIWNWAKDHAFSNPGTPTNVRSLDEEVRYTDAKGNLGVVHMQIPSNASNPNSEIICKEQTEYTAKIVKNLSDYEKTIFYERVSKKTSYKRLGKKVGKSTGTVWKKCKQLALQLKDEFYKIDYRTKANKLAEVM